MSSQLTKFRSALFPALAALALLALPTLLAGQDSGEGSLPPSPSENAEKGKLTEVRTIFGEPFRGHWTFSGDARATQQYDDNVFPGNSLRLSDNVSDFSLRVSAAIRTKHLTFQAHYLPQYTLHAKYDQSNTFSQQYSQELTYKLSARTNLGWSSAVSRIETGSNSPFLLVQFAPDNAAPVFFPEALQQNTNMLFTSTSLTASHQFTARWSMNAAITGAFTKFTTSSSTPLFANLANESFQTGGSMGIDYTITSGKKVGFQLNDSYAGFLNPSAHQNYQSALVTYSQALPGKFFLSVGAGPSFSSVQASASSVGSGELSYAANASLSRVVRGYNVGLSFIRGSQLGAIQGTIATMSSSINASKNFGRRWNSGASFSYSQLRTLDLRQQSESYASTASIGYALSSDLQLLLRYSYVNQLSPLLGQTFDHNIYGMTLAYTFGQHRGR
jgi:hypothetical protein